MYILQNKSIYFNAILSFGIAENVMKDRGFGPLERRNGWHRSTVCAEMCAKAGAERLLRLKHYEWQTEICHRCRRESVWVEKNMVLSCWQCGVELEYVLFGSIRRGCVVCKLIACDRWFEFVRWIMNSIRYLPVAVKRYCTTIDL